MNKARRAQLRAIASELEDLKSRLESIQDEEREAFDNLSENLQESERGQAINAAAENLERAVGDLEEVVSAIDDAIG